MGLLKTHVSPERFEKELLEVLKKDPDHSVTFDGTLRFRSSRYDADLRAVNLHWDGKSDSIVLVGVSRWEGRRRDDAPLDPDDALGMKIDRRDGYPVVRTKVSVPFMEVFHDMCRDNTKGLSFHGSYLVSKARKAVLEKYIAWPLRHMEPLLRKGAVHFDDFIGKDVTFPALVHDVESARIGMDGNIEVMSKAGIPVSVRDMSLEDIRRLGERLSYGRALFRDAARTFSEAKQEVTSPGGLSRTFGEVEDRLGEERGLAAIYGRYPLRVCHGVASSLAKYHRNVFSTLHSEAEIRTMMEAYRKTGRDFGRFGNGISM